MPQTAYKWENGLQLCIPGVKGLLLMGVHNTGVVFKSMLLKLDIEETEKVSVCLVVGICDSIT